ncbi:hypothetical protein D0863_04401 [Hortaea werneckii]|uniref:Isochorismatase-like domain-containing protein n=1 Tax=Hortaea werneckii TaxID=91943 RepID=A0A3M7E7Y5_HORWE|nr:hypothetical protein D0863_04401 [Hortaea werneckii]
MRTTPLTTALLSAAVTTTLAQSSGKPGYTCFPDCVPSTLNSTQAANLTFGRHYAVLNLDLINALIDPIASTPEAQTWINSTSCWIDAVHAQQPPPLSIWTRIYFTNPSQPELGPSTPFRQIGGALGAANDSNTFIYPAFHVDEAAGDAVLAKTRYYAGFGNSLEEILRAQQIDTVVLSGIRTTGVVVNTAYRLFNLDYNVYIIANNTIETPPDDPAINYNLLAGALPKVPVNVITLDQALAALQRSGPAVY